MEPRIEYASSADGVSIACWALGDGPPLLSLLPMPGHVQAEWRLRVTGDIYRSLLQAYRVIRFDGRDSGLSQRTGAAFSFDAFALDVDAVADHFRIPSFAIYASGPAGLLAMDYATRRPERVSALVLNEAFATSDALMDNPQVRGLMGLLQSDYELYTETMGSVFWGWASNEPAREFAALMRESQTADEARRYAEGFMAADVSDRLPLIKARTLILHHRRATLVPIEAIRSLAARIPGARLAIVEGETVAGSSTDEEATVLDRFLLGEDAPARAQAIVPDTRTRGMAVIVFADIADSAGLTERMGDAAFRAASRSLDPEIRAAISDSGGSTVEGKVLGDGVMGVFTSAAQAIEAARRCVELSTKNELPMHIGLHAGDVIREDNNVYGGAVNIAARICALCDPGEILVSQTVRDLARTSAGVAFEDRGEQTLKGIDDAVRVFAVRPESG